MSILPSELWLLLPPAIVGVALATRFTNLRHRALFDAFAACAFAASLAAEKTAGHFQIGGVSDVIWACVWAFLIARGFYAVAKPEKFFTHDETGRVISRSFF